MSKVLGFLSCFCSHSLLPSGGVDFDAGGNGGTLLMDDEAREESKPEPVFEEPFLTDDQLNTK